MRPSDLGKQKTIEAMPGSAIKHSRGGGSLATIAEMRDEVIRSADPNLSKSRQMAAWA